MLLIVAASLSVVSCSDDDDKKTWNSNASSATVSMGYEQISFKENKDLVTIPINVTGDRNGYVQVTLEVEETGTTPAIEDAHYIATSKTINIAPEDEVGYFEFRTIDDDDINEDRTFLVKIVSVQGATVGTPASTLVTLKDNDSEFYEKLQGSWVMTVQGYGETETETWNVNVVGFDETEAGYNETLYITGMMGYSWTQAELKYEYNKATNEGSISFVFPSLFAEEVNFGLGGYNNVYIFGLSEEGSVTYDPLYGYWNDDFSKVTFNEFPYVYGRIFNTDGSDTGYYWFVYRIISLTKK